MRPAGASASSSTTIASSYRLEGEASKLSPHVGHKVEITGVVDPASAASGGASSTAPATSMASAPHVKVESVKMIASTCTP
jgi:hypothetical protein